MKKTVLSLVLLALSGVAGASNIVLNGDFQANTCGPSGTKWDGDSNNYETIVKGSTCITNWTVGGPNANSSVDLIKTQYGAINGISIDLAGTPGPGSIEQLLNTTAGQTYELKFDLGSNGSNTVRVWWDNIFKDLTKTQPGLSQPMTWLFTADDSSTILKFDSIIGGNGGPVVDNISVSAVPLPGAALLFGSVLAGAGFMSRKKMFKGSETAA